MALIACPECGKQVSSHAIACPNCGCPIADPQLQVPTALPEGAPVGPNYARTIRVGANSDTGYATISEAIASVSSDLTLIVIAPGVYKEHLSISRSVTLKAETRGSVRIESNNHNTIVVAAPDVQLNGIEIISHSRAGLLIEEHGTATTVTDCIILGATAIDIRDNSTLKVTTSKLTSEECAIRFYDSEAYFTASDITSKEPIDCDGRSTLTFDSCTINADFRVQDRSRLRICNGSGSGEVTVDSIAKMEGSRWKAGEYGLLSVSGRMDVFGCTLECDEDCYMIRVTDSGKLNMSDCTIQYNGDRIPLSFDNDGASVIENCNVSCRNVEEAIRVSDSHSLTLRRTSVSGCECVGRFYTDGKVTVEGCDFRGCDSEFEVDSECDFRERNNRY